MNVVVCIAYEIWLKYLTCGINYERLFNKISGILRYAWKSNTVKGAIEFADRSRLRGCSAMSRMIQHSSITSRHELTAIHHDTQRERHT